MRVHQKLVVAVAASIIAIALAVASFASDGPALGPNLVINSSFEEIGSDGLPVGWATRTWAGSAEHLVIENGGRGGGNAIAIRSGSGADADWEQVVTGLEVGAQYHLSAWIKTEDVAGALGATVSMHEMQDMDGSKGSRTEAFYGTNDWTYRETVFYAEQSELTVLALFGGWGLTSGTAIYDELQLRKVL